jgi:hypothetical protein
MIHPHSLNAGHFAGPVRSRWTRFFATRTWLVLRNVIGWLLILASFVAGPLVPGPGGIPLFLLGFALVSFPGKRRLTARVLRGRPVRVPGRPLAFASIAASIGLPAILLLLAHDRSSWLAGRYPEGPVAAGALYVVVGTFTWLAVRQAPRVLNGLLRMVSRTRRRVRPWLRHHGIHLLPPRWRRRMGHEPGTGPLRIAEEILTFHRRTPK